MTPLRKGDVWTATKDFSVADIFNPSVVWQIQKGDCFMLLSDVLLFINCNAQARRFYIAQYKLTAVCILESDFSSGS